MDSQPNQFTNYRNPQSKNKKPSQNKKPSTQNQSPTILFPNNFIPQQPIQPTNLFGSPASQPQFSPSGFSNIPLMSPPGNFYPYGSSYNPSFYPFMQAPLNNEDVASPASGSNNAPTQVDYSRFSLRDEDDEPPEQHFSKNVVIEDEEEVEVQPEPEKITRKKGKGKATKEKAADDKRIPWSPTEEICLFKAYIDISENPIIGRDQSSKSFWVRVTDSFHEQMDQGIYRTRDCIYSKFNAANAELVCFLGLLNNNVQGRKSGWSNEDVFTFSLREYANIKGKTFKFAHLIEVVKRHPKWMKVDGGSHSSGGSNKRSKNTSEGAHTDTGSPFDLNEDFYESFHMPERPVGKKRASKTAATDSSSTPSFGTTKKHEDVNVIAAQLEKANALKEREQAFKEREQNIQILREPLDNKTDMEREIWLELKAAAAEKLRKSGF